MSIIVKRATKGSALTSGEIDANVNNLNNDKVEINNPTFKAAPSLVNNLIPLTGTVLPAIYPSLNLDFANGKQLDPRITFSRNTVATYYDGKSVAKAEENLLIYSQDFSNAVWSGAVGSSNATIAPDGSNTGFNASSSGGIQTVFINSSTSYTVSLYIKANTGTTISIRIVNRDSSNVFISAVEAAVDMVAGTTSIGSITNVGNNWYRINFNFTTPSNGNRIWFYPVYTIVSNVYIWGAQLEQRSSVTSYTPTTSSPITKYIPTLVTAPANVPRLDYDPITKKPLGLLIEEGRTNLALYSEAMQYGSKATFTGNATGTFVADEVVNASGGGSAVVVERSSATVLFLKNQVGNFSGTLTGVTSGATGTLGVNTIVDLWGANKLTSVSSNITGTLGITCITLSPDSKFLYTTNRGNNGIQQYSRDISTGILTPLSPATISANTSEDLKISPDGNFAYVTQANDNTILQYSRNISTGLLTPLSPASISTGTTPSKITISSDGKYVYVGFSTGFSIFSRDISTGLLTALVDISTTTSISTVIISPNGLFVYATGYSSIVIFQYSRDIATGLVTALSPASVSSGSSPTDIVISSDSKYVYLTSLSQGIRQYNRDIVTGLLTPLSPASIVLSNQPESIAISASGSFAVVAGKAGSNLFSIDPSTGVLTAISASLFTNGSVWSRSVIISPDDNYVYVPHYQGGTTNPTIYQFKINPSSPLTLTANSTVSPTGTITASTLTAVYTNATLQQSFTGTAASYTFSVYLKRKSGSGTVSISCDGVNFTTCVVTSTGWTRFTDKRTLTAATYNAIIKLDTAGDEVFAWGGQVEVGPYGHSVATSYIPTTGTALSRAADNASMTGTNFSSWYNSTEGSFYCEAKSSVAQAIFTVRQSTANIYANTLFKNDQRPAIYNPALIGNLTPGTITLNVFMKVAWSFNGVAYKSSADGNTAVAGTATQITNLLDTLFIGASTLNSYGLCGHIKKLTYYPKALTAVELKGLTS